MSNRPLPKGPSKYRIWAAETRAKAQAAADKETREALLKDAEVWDGLADWVETRPPNGDQISN